MFNSLLDFIDRIFYKKTPLYVLNIDNVWRDLPKSMPVPEIGSIIFYGNAKKVEVVSVEYYLYDRKFWMINVVGRLIN